MKITRRRGIVGICVAAAAVVPSAQGVITVNRGAAGIQLDMTKAKVRTVLGAPAATKTVKNPITGTANIHTYRGLVVHYFGGRVGTIVVTRTTEKTRRGVGVGSTEVQLRAAVGGLTCSTTSGIRICSVGTFMPGTAATTFDIRGGKVWRVRIGRVID